MNVASQCCSVLQWQPMNQEVPSSIPNQGIAPVGAQRKGHVVVSQRKGEMSPTTALSACHTLSAE